MQQQWHLNEHESIFQWFFEAQKSLKCVGLGTWGAHVHARSLIVRVMTHHVSVIPRGL